MSNFTKAVALSVLALWGLATMHCKLEVLPGFDFLASCCAADSATACPVDCESDGCCAVEDGSYRAEEQPAAAPQPLLVLALAPAVIDAPMPELRGIRFAEAQAPPELSRFWQFTCRAALPPRAPTVAS